MVVIGQKAGKLSEIREMKDFNRNVPILVVFESREL
jgi:hypothetical protein